MTNTAESISNIIFIITSIIRAIIIAGIILFASYLIIVYVIPFLISTIQTLLGILVLIGICFAISSNNDSK